VGESRSSLARLPIPAGSSLGCRRFPRDSGAGLDPCHHRVLAEGAGSGHGRTPSPRLPPPSPGSTPSRGVTVPVGLPWGCSGAGCGVSPLPCHPTAPRPCLQGGRCLPPCPPAVVALLLMSALMLPFGSSLPLEVPAQRRGERHFGLRKDTRRGSPVCR